MANSGASDGPAGFAIFDVLFYTDGGVVKTEILLKASAHNVMLPAARIST